MKAVVMEHICDSWNRYIVMIGL